MIARTLIEQVAAGRSPRAVLAEEDKSFGQKVSDKQKQIADLEKAASDAKDADERELKQAKLKAAQAELKHMQAAGPKDESLRESGAPNWNDAQTIARNMQHDIQSLNQAIKDQEPTHVGLALAMLLSALEHLADVSMERGVVHGLIDQGNKARDWALARHKSWGASKGSSK